MRRRHQVKLYLTEEAHDTLRAASSRTTHSMSSLVIMLVNEHLRQHAPSPESIPLTAGAERGADVPPPVKASADKADARPAAPLSRPAKPEKDFDL
jgi:hypothetical protein